MTYSDRLEKEDSSQLNTVPLRPAGLCKCWRNVWWSTASNAAAKSKRMRRDGEHGNSCHQQVICEVQQSSFCAGGGVKARLVLYQDAVVLKVASNNFP